MNMQMMENVYHRTDLTDFVVVRNFSHFICHAVQVPQ